MGDWDRAARETLVIDGHHLAYESAGQGDETYVFLHGVTASLATWHAFAAPFRQRGRVILLSLPGHYPATFPPDYTEDQITPAAWGDLGGRAIAALTGGRPVTLIGHSTGGFWALAIAWRAPQIVTRAVSIGGFAWGHWHGLLGLQQRLLLALGRPYRPVFKGLFRLIARAPYPLIWRWRGRDLAEADVMTRYLVESYPDTCQLDMDAMAQIFRAMRRDVDLRPHLGEIQAPVLAVTGDADPLVPPYHAQAITAGVPAGTLFTLPGGHMGLLQTPEVVQAALLEWLDAHPVAPAAESLQAAGR